MYVCAVTTMAKSSATNRFFFSEALEKSMLLEPQILALLFPLFPIVKASREAVNSWNSCIFIVSMHEHSKAIERLTDNDLLILFAVLGFFIHHRIVGWPALTLSLGNSSGPEYQ